ncbi:MAG: MFS transporter [Burkholderiales bacterium]
MSGAFSPRRESLLLYALAGVQFTTVLDFMLMMPLGPQLMRVFAISPTQFGLLVSSYTLTAAGIGFLAALFVDRFDRRHTLLALYACFTLTTILAATAQTYAWLLVARATAGAFGGLMGACVFAIVGDVIPERRRGSALGLVVSAFSIASIVGIPLSLTLAAYWSWRAPYVLLTLLGVVNFAVVFTTVPRMGAHVEAARARNPITQVRAVFSEPNHLRAFLFAAMLTFSGFTVVPFISPYMVANVGVSETELAWLYLVGGLVTLGVVRLVGRLSDLHGRRRIFIIVAAISMLGIFVTTHLPRVPLWVAILASCLLMPTFSGRFVPAMAIITAAVQPRLRGSFMSFNAAIQQLASGSATFLSSLAIGKSPSGELTHFGTVGWVAVGATLVCIFLARRVRSTRQ